MNMSYRLNMNLKQFNGMDNYYEFANNVVTTIMRDSKSLLSDKLYCIPRTEIDNEYPYWLYSFYNFKFVYFKDFDVLGLIGDYGNNTNNMFDTNFYFQNSSDQNYEYDSWSDKIKIFKETKEWIISLSDKELADVMVDSSDYYKESDKDDILLYADYYRKTFLYESITDRLGVIDFIYDKDSKNIDIFVLNGIRTEMQYFELCQHFQDITKQFQKKDTTER